MRESGALTPSLPPPLPLPPPPPASLDDISKGVLYIESDKCARARVARFIAMMGQYAALCIASGVRAQELWTSFMSAMELEQNTQVTDAQSTLTGASSMHGLDAVAGSPNSLHVPTAVLQGAAFAPSGAAGAASPAYKAAPVEPAPSSGGALFSGSSSSAAAPAPSAPAPPPAPAAEASIFGGADGAVDL